LLRPRREGAAVLDRPVGALDRWCRRAVLRSLEGLRVGQLVVEEPQGAFRFGESPPVAAGRGDSSLQPLSAVVVVRDPRFYRHVLFGGSLGAAEAYIRGYWETDRLVELIRLFCRNDEAAGRLERRGAWLLRPVRRFAHWLHRNTLRGSRANIEAHYDLSNDFFATFLDETMNYSCAIFPHEDASIEQAVRTKYDRICRKLDLKPEDHLLEIGTGWGGLACYAARHFGCRVTTTTISARQAEFAREAIHRAELHDRITLLEEDYRNLSGSFDKLVSVEMIEAVGPRYFDTFFNRCAALLKPGGTMLLQAITVADQQFAAHRRSVDFIKRYIFPGGCLPSVTAICDSLTRSTDLRVVHLEDITSHYAATLSAWRKRFWQHRDDVAAMGLPESFLRMWHYYFCYCEGAFRERATGDVQMLLAKPLWRGPAPLGAFG
jgi:cyclopropane-fatty-acyl-phospholipid synthase